MIAAARLSIRAVFYVSGYLTGRLITTAISASVRWRK